MNAALIRKAAALPPRQLHLLGAGLLLIVAAGLWFYALRAPLAALRAVRAEQAQLALAGNEPRLLAAQLAVLDTDVEVLVKRLGAVSAHTAAQPAVQPLVRLIGELGALAQARNVTLHGVTPVPEETVVSFSQTGFDADVSGSYASLLAWMGAIEGAQPNLAIVSFDMRAGDKPGQVAMKIRVAALQPQGNNP